MEVSLSEKTKILLVGARGQLGTALQQQVPNELDVLGVGHAQVDVTDEQAVRELVEDFRPNQILNVAAYTDVDRAEEDLDRAMAVNGQGVEYLASAAQKVHARVLHVSTDYIFDGKSETPYRPADRPNPLNFYGKSKLAGEEMLQAILPGDHLLLRTAWLYSRWSNNFVKTMLRLMRERDELRVVADQVGTPTSALSLAEVIWRLVQRPDLVGIYHWTDAGQASWYDFACEIHRLAVELGLIDRPCKIVPITSPEYPTPAMRPKWSVLDSSSLCEALNIQQLDWHVRLKEVLKDFSQASK